MEQLLINNDHKALANIGTNTHAQIDTAISNSVSHIAGVGAAVHGLGALSVEGADTTALTKYLLLTGGTLSGALAITNAGNNIFLTNSSTDGTTPTLKLRNSGNTGNPSIEIMSQDGTFVTGRISMIGTYESISLSAPNVNGRLYLAGGSNGSIRLGTTWILNGRTFNVYNTDPDVASVSERFQFDWSSNVGQIFGRQGASGTARDIAFGANNAEYFRLLGASTSLQLIEGLNIILGTTTGTQIGTVGGASGQKLGFWGTAAIVQPVLATGAGKVVDDVITVLQNLGLVRQS